jgi:hypothetical protein
VKQICDAIFLAQLIKSSYHNLIEIWVTGCDPASVSDYHPGGKIVKQMIRIIKKWIFLAIIVAAAFNLTEAQAVRTEIADLRSVTLYDISKDWTDDAKMNALKARLPAIKAQGFNSVWIVVPWHIIESNVGNSPTSTINTDGSVVNTANLNRVLSFITEAKSLGMTVIWPINYLGVNWAPTGINAARFG